jgi:hypothetical protein
MMKEWRIALEVSFKNHKYSNFYTKFHLTDNLIHQEEPPFGPKRYGNETSYGNTIFTRSTG